MRPNLIKLRIDSLMHARRVLGALFAACLLFSLPATGQEGGGPAGGNAGGSTTNQGAAPTAPVQVSPVERPVIITPAAPAVPAQPGAAPQPGAGQPGAAPAANAQLDRAESNEFQDFVAGSVGRQLPVFGHDLFRGVPSTFAPLDRVPVPADYSVGPGDEILIRAWGQIDVDLRLVVDRDGTINIPRVGVVNIAGIRNQDLPAYLKNAIGRVFRNFDLSVTLGQLRSIQVFVVGQARRPGTYTVSSLSTLVNTLFASGGPSARGSMRKIQLKRGAALVTEFDLYDLLVKGDKSRDRMLQPGDVIYIPPVGSLAAISGSVNQPAIFELKGGETLNDLLEYAGGLTTTAAGQKVVVERIEDRKARVVADFSLDAAGRQRALRDGDLVRVFSMTPRFENAVTLRGAVANPGRYPWSQGMRVKDLLPSREALIVPEYWSRVNAAVGRDAPAGTGALRAEVKRHFAEPNWEYAAVERLNTDRLTTILIPFNLGKAVLKGDPDQNIQLQPGDIVTIFSTDDIQLPIATQSKYVRLEGEVIAPGVYQVLPGETLRQLLARVGGASPNAYIYGAEFTRESVRAQQQKRLDEFVQQLALDVERQATTGATAESVEAAKTQAESQRRLVDRLRQAKATGRIVLELYPDRAQLKDIPEVALEDGDRLVVPPRPSTVSVIGAVYNANAMLYRPDRRVEDYLGMAGGPTKHADTDSIYVVRADGTVISKSQSNWMIGFYGDLILPGDAIFVPEQLDKYRFVRDLKDWTQILMQFGLGIAGLVEVFKD
jgi:protein involved in polysaccharide export with SLBB domain